MLCLGLEWLMDQQSDIMEGRAGVIVKGVA
jgi:hypothetical protein